MALTDQDINGVINYLRAQMVPGDCNQIGHNRVLDDTATPYIIVNDITAVPTEAFEDPEVYVESILRIDVIAQNTTTESWQEVARRLHDKMITLLVPANLTISGYKIDYITPGVRESTHEEFLNSDQIFNHSPRRWNIGLSPL